MKDAIIRGPAFGCISKYKSGNGGFAEELDTMGTRPGFLCPLGT